MALVPALAACSFDGGVALGLAPDGGNPLRPDADPGIDSSNDRDGGDPTGLHLLLSEVKNTNSGTEFIEIYNPTAQVVGLGDYYLSDNAAYAIVSTGAGPGPKPPVSKSDFIARFPAGTSIVPGQALVIGVEAFDFYDTFGFYPNFTIGNSGGGIEMGRAFPSSVGSQSSLTDMGEGIVLFFWDGESDLVTDVDMLIVGSEMTITVANTLANKTGLSVDGPDADNIKTPYKTDVASMQGFDRGTLDLESFARMVPETGAELHLGVGNGRFGQDESSEDTGATWAIIEVATPGVAAPGL